MIAGLLRVKFPAEDVTDAGAAGMILTPAIAR